MNMNRTISASLVLLIAAASLAAAQDLPAGGRRVALVMGNSAYLHVPPLANPVNDATDVSAALRAIGFEVITLTDGTYALMLDAVERFRRAMAGASVGLFYYAGHGIQAQGQNYLLPVDANAVEEYQLKAMALDAALVMDVMNMAAAGLNIVVLDACRNNPFAPSGRGIGTARGLSVMGTDLKGALIAYATGPGKEAMDGDGRNGIYTAALLRHIGTPGLDIKEVFDRVGAEVALATKGAQTPWINSQFYGKFALVPAPAATVPSAGTSATPVSALTAAPVPMPAAASAGVASVKVGLVTDSAGIDDKSFNQGAWEGMARAAANLFAGPTYVKPSGPSAKELLAAIDGMYAGGCRVFVLPGFQFETAAYQAQKAYPDAHFVVIDATARKPDGGESVGPNTVAVFFAEHEAGFMAGVAAALQLKSGSFGFIGGMAIPPVQKFNWGFQQGVAYANASLGTKVVLKPENVVYADSFNDRAIGRSLAASMYDRGVVAIFAAAGALGLGVFDEARDRAEAGRTAWIVGVDIDQYELGRYGDGSRSVTLTSAIKRVDSAAYEMISAHILGTFPGGRTLMFNAKNEGVGLPASNPNLSAEVQAQLDAVYRKLRSGAIVVSDKRGRLLP